MSSIASCPSVFLHTEYLCPPTEFVHGVPVRCITDGEKKGKKGGRERRRKEKRERRKEDRKGRRKGGREEGRGEGREEGNEGRGGRDDGPLFWHPL
jgi:hypothetical protein